MFDGDRNSSGRSGVSLHALSVDRGWGWRSHQYRKHAGAVKKAVRAAAARQQEVCQRMMKKLQVVAKTAAAKIEAEHQRTAQELREMRVCTTPCHIPHPHFTADFRPA